MFTERVKAFSFACDSFNEWVVEVDGIRRGRWMGPDAAFRAACAANEWRATLASEEAGDA